MSMGTVGPFLAINIARSYKQIEDWRAPSKLEVELLDVPEVWLILDEVVPKTNKLEIKHYEFP